MIKKAKRSRGLRIILCIVTALCAAGERAGPSVSMNADASLAGHATVAEGGLGAVDGHGWRSLL